MTGTTVTNLGQLWRSTVSSPASEVEAVLEDLVARWSAPSRHYHNLEHLEECLAELRDTQATQTVSDRRAVTLALWFHDAIYDPTRGDNEAASGDLALTQLRRLGETDDLLGTVRELILDTSHRFEPKSAAGQWIVDIDLAILGKPVDRFDRYDAAIRQEYAHVPWPAYCDARAEVLRRFLARPRVYRTPVFIARYESIARQNLARAIRKLESQ